MPEKRSGKGGDRLAEEATTGLKAHAKSRPKRRGPSMRTSHENPTIVKGKGIGHRRLSGDDGADLVLDFWTCVKHLDQPSLQQALALVPGVSRAL